MKKNKIILSIIVTTKNSELFLERNLKSITTQTCKDYEIILVDGNSKDKTIAIIKKYKNYLKKIVTGEDRGPYHAMNTGVNYSNGEYIIFLNSDDFFYNDKSVYNIVNKIKLKNPNCLYGNLEIVKKNKIFRKWKSGNFGIKEFISGWHPPHPGMCIKKKLFLKLGGFDTRYKIASDYDLMVRAFYKKKIKPIYLDKTLVKMETGGLSSKISNIIISNFECYLSRKKAGLKNPFFLMKKIYFKFTQLQ